MARDPELSCLHRSGLHRRIFEGRQPVHRLCFVSALCVTYRLIHPTTQLLIGNKVTKSISMHVHSKSIIIAVASLAMYGCALVLRLRSIIECSLPEISLNASVFRILFPIACVRTNERRKFSVDFHLTSTSVRASDASQKSNSLNLLRDELDEQDAI